VSDSTTKQIWLHIAKEGGRWDTASIRRGLEVDPGPNLAQFLASMADRHLIVRYRGATRNEYGVTSSCFIPLGLTLAEITAAGIA
jgi:hypothetical protein